MDSIMLGHISYTPPSLTSSFEPSEGLGFSVQGKPAHLFQVKGCGG